MSRAKEIQANNSVPVRETSGLGLPAKKPNLYIGIDTGTQTGFAVYCPVSKCFFKIETLPIHKALELTLHYHKVIQYDILVRVEDARMAVHGRGSKDDSSKLQGAGSIKRDASIWEDFLKDYKIPYQMVRPNKRITKLTQEQFQQTTKYIGRTSSHARDAAMLIFGL